MTDTYKPLEGTPTFRLGLTMAGAVSAGAYTGGVMDYLIEALEAWQEEKQHNQRIAIKNDIKTYQQLLENLAKPNTRQVLVDQDYKLRIPMHEVWIEVMGGASAGGFTTSMCLLAFAREKHKAVTDKTNGREQQDNIFYDSWVSMLDEKQEDATLHELLDDEDLIYGQLPSLLNSQGIDNLAEKAFALINKDLTIKKPYVNSNLHLILTQCNLRGVPVRINFQGGGVSSRYTKQNVDISYDMSYHIINAHFKVGDKDSVAKEFIPLDFKDYYSTQLFKQCSLATGAFPFGLRPRKFDKVSFKKPYLYNQIANELGAKNNPKITIGLGNTVQDFFFTSVDGGTLNNEPFGEVLKVLENRSTNPPWNSTPIKEEDKDYAIIMIDPFPNFTIGPSGGHVASKTTPDDYQHPEELTQLVQPLYNTLRKQSSFKYSDIVRSTQNDPYISVIFPAKWVPADDGSYERAENPIACASLGAFGGFLDIKFRKHDFFLGRDNARNFINRYFVLRKEMEGSNAEASHSLFEGMTQEAFELFHTKGGTKEAPETYAFIIPDMMRLEKTEKELEQTWKDYKYKEFPKAELPRILSLEDKIKKRAKTFVDVSVYNATKNRTRNKKKVEGTSARVKRYLFSLQEETPKKVITSSIGQMGMELGLHFGKKKIAAKAAKAILYEIVKDLNKRGLIE